jgi:DNA-3-methyladenine glycosylase
MARSSPVSSSHPLRAIPPALRACYNPEVDCFPLPRPFFERPTLQVARDLLGQRLVRRERGGQRTSGWITETEAYIGPQDLACHARSGRTARNAVMWGPAGYAYVYFTYGMHWCLNLVTQAEGFPAAVLLRGLLADEGRTRMLRRRRQSKESDGLLNGPAKLCQALGIDGAWDGHDLCREGSRLWVEPWIELPESAVTLGPRVGLTSVPEPWKGLPWRFRVAPALLASYAH